jgi:Leucine-rich repeat (LRR) protein
MNCKSPKNFKAKVLIRSHLADPTTGIETKRAWWRDVARRVSGERILQLGSDGSTPHVTSLASLAGLTNLCSLWLTHAQVRDLTPLAGLTNLEYLYLYGAPVSDLAPLSGLKNLKRLNVCGSKVSDITPLTGLSKLAFLSVRYTRVTKEQVEALQKTLPHCEIEHDTLPLSPEPISPSP